MDHELNKLVTEAANHLRTSFQSLIRLFVQYKLSFLFSCTESSFS